MAAYSRRILQFPLPPPTPPHQRLPLSKPTHDAPHLPAVPLCVLTVLECVEPLDGNGSAARKGRQR